MTRGEKTVLKTALVVGSALVLGSLMAIASEKQTGEVLDSLKRNADKKPKKPDPAPEKEPTKKPLVYEDAEIIEETKPTIEQVAPIEETEKKVGLIRMSARNIVNKMKLFWEWLY